MAQRYSPCVAIICGPYMWHRSVANIYRLFIVRIFGPCTWAVYHIYIYMNHMCLASFCDPVPTRPLAFSVRTISTLMPLLDCNLPTTTYPDY